jgi:hypothetical protein
VGLRRAVTVSGRRFACAKICRSSDRRDRRERVFSWAVRVTK